MTVLSHATTVRFCAACDDGHYFAPRLCWTSAQRPLSSADRPSTTDTPTPVPSTTISEETVIEPEPSAVGVDPSFALRTKMRVFRDAGRPLGEIDSLEYDAESGFLSSLIVRHGVPGRSHTFIPAEHVRQINDVSLILQLSYDDPQGVESVEGR